MESDSDSDKNVTPKKKRQIRGELKYSKHRKQSYSKLWELNPKYKHWLKPIKGSPFNAICSYCNVTLASEISSLNKHLHSIKHVTNSKSIKNTPTITSNFKKSEQSPLDEKVKLAEIKLYCWFIAEHNISFLTMDHLSDLLKNCFSDSEITQNINLKRTKTTCIVKNVIGKVHKENLVDILKSTMFSILTDESTDISCIKHACVVVRYFNRKLGKICSHFYDLSPVFEPKDYEKIREGATGKNLYESLIKSFNFFDIPLENIIGFGSDGCNSMMGFKTP